MVPLSTVNSATTKEGVLTSVVVLLDAVVFMVYAWLLPRAATGSWQFSGLLILLALWWLAGTLLALALCRRVVSTLSLCLLPALAVVVVSGFSTVVMGGALLLAIFTLLASRTLIRDEQNRLTLRTTQIFTGATRLLALGLLITLTSLAWPVLTDSVKTTRLAITERQIAPLLRPLEPVIRDFLPGYSSQASLDDLLDVRLAEEKKKLPPGAVIDPAQEQRIREDLKQRLGENVSGHEGLAAIVAGTLNRSLNRLATQSPVQASLLLAVLAFLTLRALLPFVVWPTLGLTGILVKLAVASKLAVLTSEPATRERLTL